MCLANIKWNSNLLGYCCVVFGRVLPPSLCFVLVWVNLGVRGLSLILMQLGVCGPLALKFSAEYLFIWLAPHQKPKLEKSWTLRISRLCWTTSFWWAGAKSKNQLYSKAWEVLHLEMDFKSYLCFIFPDSSVSYPVLLCSCSDRQDRDFVIRSLPSYGVPAVFHRQLSFRGWGSFAFTMLHTALNCVEKAKYCRPDAAFPLPFISLESNFTPGMALCLC